MCIALIQTFNQTKFVFGRNMDNFVSHRYQIIFWDLQHRKKKDCVREAFQTKKWGNLGNGQNRGGGHTGLWSLTMRPFRVYIKCLGMATLTLFFMAKCLKELPTNTCRFDFLYFERFFNEFFRDFFKIL